MTFEDDLLALERRVLTDAAGDFLKAVDELRTMLAMQDSGIVAKLIRLAIPRVEEAARAGVLEGFTLGGQWALDSLPVVDEAVESQARAAIEVMPGLLIGPIVGLDIGLSVAHMIAIHLIRAGAEMDAALAPVFASATKVKATIETQINAASNTASQMVGEAAGTPMVWEAERDACVYCLALAGEVVERSGDEFPKPDLYADGALSKVTTSQPPLHPHCRCRLAVLADQSYADGLKREAQRSILRGFSLQSESNKVRVDAARRLLARDPVAPKSVKQYAAKAVREGKFPRGREVPDGDPRLVIR